MHGNSEKCNDYFFYRLPEPDHVFYHGPEIPFFPCFCLPRHQPLDDILGPQLKSRVEMGHTLRWVTWPGGEIDDRGGCTIPQTERQACPLRPTHRRSADSTIRLNALLTCFFKRLITVSCVLISHQVLWVLT
jgi:hypothetical protein